MKGSFTDKETNSEVIGLDYSTGYYQNNIKTKPNAYNHRILLR